MSDFDLSHPTHRDGDASVSPHPRRPASPAREPTASPLESVESERQANETVVSAGAGGGSWVRLAPDDPGRLGATFFTRFEQHEVIGRGGFGIVYRAYDCKLKRFVALKVPHRALVDGSSGRRPLQREAEATARLRHPHIVALHDFILDDQDAILVSELIEGETLAAWLRSDRAGCTPHVAAALIWRMAQAVQHAHDQSVLHRDIKPSNILLDRRHHDIRLPFVPMLADFGVARIVKDETVTETQGNFVGTYCYTPPEVISRGVGAYSDSSDIYSLGVVLYELLVGRRPFTGETIPDLLQKISEGTYATPRHLRSEVPRDLEAICLQCMAYRPADRYATAADLAADLDRFLRGEPVRARSPGVTERAVRWVQRYPARVAMIAAAATALIAFLLFLSATNHKLERLNLRLVSSNERLTKALRMSQKELFYNEQSKYADDMQEAFAALAYTGLRDARAYLGRYADGLPLAKNRDMEWHYLCLRAQRNSSVLWRSAGPLYALAHVGELIAVGGAESTVTLLDPRTGRVVHQWSTDQGEVNAIAVDEQRNHLWSSGDDGTLVAFNLQSKEELHRRRLFEEREAHDTIVVRELDRLFCLSAKGTLGAIDLASGELVEDWPAPQTSGCTLVSIGDGQIAISDGKQITLIDGRQGERLDQLQIDLEQSVQWMAVDRRRGHLLISCGKVLSTIGLTNLEVLNDYPLPDSPTSIVYDAPRDRYIVSLRGGGIHVYQVDTEGRLTLQDAWINDGERLYFTGVSPIDGTVLTLGLSGWLHAWSPPVKTQWTVNAEDEITVQAFDFYEPHRGDIEPTLVIGGEQGLFLHHLADDSWTRKAAYSWGIANLVALGADRLAIAPVDQSTQIIDFAGAVSATFAEQGYRKLGLTSDGRWLMGADRVHGGSWFRAIDGSGSVRRLPSENPWGIAVSSRRDRVFWNDDLTVMTQSLEGSEPPVHCATFRDVPSQLVLSADEQTLAIGLTDREVHLWDCRKNEAVGSVLMHPSGIEAIKFSPFGHALLTVDEQGTLRSWNLATGDLTLEENFGGAEGLAYAKFSRDARYLGLQYNNWTLRVVRLY